MAEPKKKISLRSITIRLPVELRQAIRAEAARQGESESLVVRQALRDYFKGEDKPT